MASSDNVTSEKTIDFEDGEYDPDLEVRLYAEIYYSNETYLPDHESSIINDEATLNFAQNAESTPSSKKSLVSNESVADGSSAPANTENHLASNNFVEDSTPGDDIGDSQNSHVGALYYPRSNWVFGESSENARDREAIEQPPVGTRSTGRKPRQLAQKGLWVTPEDTERERSAIGHTNVTPIRNETSTPDGRVSDPNCVDRLTTNRENDLNRNDSCTRDNNRQKRKRKNLKKNVSKQACAKKTLSRNDTTDDTRVTVETEKDKVVTKTKKMRKKKRNSAPLVISSESDDDIVEVPVPPKPPPLIIQLPDSDDDCDRLADDGVEKAKKSSAKENDGLVLSHDLEMESSTLDASSKSPVTEPYPISNEATHTTRDAAEVSVEAASPDGDTLILNCTQIQRGASSLDEIRQMRGSGPSINLHSDDSMTESEANNWVNIAAGQSDAPKNQDICSVDLSNETVDIAAGQVDATRDRDICSVDLSNELVNIERWNQMRHENSMSAGIPTEIPCNSDDGNTADRAIANKEKTSSESTINKEKSSSVPTINKEKTLVVSTVNKGKTLSVPTINKEKTSSPSTINKEKTSSPSTINKEKTSSVSTVNKGKTSSASTTNKDVAGARKRQKKGVTRPFTDFDVPAIPPKRSKRVRDRELSEYFFKPMSNELQAFYNNPWGGENLNLYDIQSRMPDNPRCWGILDVDLQGPTSNRRRGCPRCNTDSHIGRRCPEKAKSVCCYMCGTMGHIESRCPHTMCLTCGRKYATYRPTCDYCSKLYCNMCNGSGHSSDNCPDLWRRYHNTTTETIPVAPQDPSNIMKAAQFLCCCNCGKRGHDMTTCQQLRWSQHFPTPMSVSSYTEGPFYESSNREQMHYESSNHDQTLYESSNRERVHYQSSNREQLPYESSYTEQMRYESSNTERMQYESSNTERMQYESSSGEQQYALPNKDCIQDVPHDERIVYPNPNAAPIYVPQHQERLQDTIPSNDIEILEIYDAPEASITTPTSSEPPSHVIFQAGDTVLPEQPFSRSASRRLDKVENIHLNGLLNGHLKPTFLHTWNKSFEFSVIITRESKNISRMTIGTDSFKLLENLEKVMMQWLMRPDDEKPNLEYKIFPYDDIDETVGNLKKKVMLLKTVLKPTVLWKKIVTGEKSLKRIREKHRRCTNQKVAEKRYKKNETGIILNTIKRRNHLVTSLYSRSWVDGGQAVVRLFKKIAHKVIATKSLSLQQYLELIYLNNELFTFHTSEALTRALDKAILESRQSESIAAPTAKKPSVDALGGKLPKSPTKSMANAEACEMSPVHLPLDSTSDDDSSSAACSPHTAHREQQVTVLEDIGESSQIPKAFGTTDATNTNSPDTKDGASIDARTVWNPMYRPPSVKEVNSQNAAKTSASPRRKIVEPSDLKNTRAIQLRNLTKRNRKLYRNSARQAIRLANATKIPHLQEMAKELKVKSGNGSITTDDVDRLQAAIKPKLSQKITQMQDQLRLRGSLKNTNDDTYKKFLESL